MNKRITLLKKYCDEHPNAFVKSPEIFIPVRTELFDFPYVNTILEAYKSGKFQVQTHKELPVIFTLEENEIESFELLFDYLLGNKINIWERENIDKISFIQFLSYVVGDQIYDFLKETGFSSYKQDLKFYKMLVKQGVTPSFLTKDRCVAICMEIIIEIVNKADLEGKGRAKTYWYEVKGISPRSFTYLKDVKPIVDICKYYGVILGQFTDFDPTYTYNADRYSISPVGRTMYFIVEEKKIESGKCIKCVAEVITTPNGGRKRCNNGSIQYSDILGSDRFCRSCLKRDDIQKIIKDKKIGQKEFCFELGDIKIYKELDSDTRKHFCSYCSDFKTDHRHGN